MRVTVIMAVLSNGEKVTPLVILKLIDSEIEKKYGLWVVYKTKIWVNQ